MNKEQYDKEVTRFVEYWNSASMETLERFRDYCFFRASTECKHPSYFLHDNVEGFYTPHDNPKLCYLGQEFYNAWENEYRKRREKN